MPQIFHKDWDINVHATSRVKKGKPIIGVTFQNGLNDIEPDGSFVPCDMELESISDGVTTHQVKRGRFGELRFTDTGSTNRHLCKIKYKNGRGISLKYLGGDSPAPDMSSGRPVFNSSDGVQIEHTPCYKGVKIELVIVDPLTAPLEYPFSIKDYGQNYTIIEENSGLTIRGDDQESVFIKAPYAVDANGEIGPVSIVNTGIQDGFKTFKKVVDETWLRQAAAPVRIDPDVTIQDGVDGGVIEDTPIVSNSPDTTGGSGIHLTSNNYYGAGLGQWACVRVDLSPYSSYTPVSGKFLARPSASNVASIPSKATKLLKPWVESTATWNSYDTGLSWETAGAQGVTDRAGSLECTFTMQNTGVTDIPITVPTLTEWKNGTNEGVVTDGNSAPSGQYVHFGSAEHGSVPIQFYYEYTEGETGIQKLRRRRGVRWM